MPKKSMVKYAVSLSLPISDENRLAPPLKQFNPQFLEGLYKPSGAVKLRDQFYIERDADAFLKHQVTT